MIDRLEKDVKEKVKSFLKSKGIFYRCISANEGVTFTGISDFLAIFPDGRFWAIETKKPGCNTISNHQFLFLDNIAKNNGVSTVANKLQDVIDAYDKKYSNFKEAKVEVKKAKFAKGAICSSGWSA